MSDISIALVMHDLSWHCRHTHTHNGLVLERPEPRCTSMSAALDVGHSRLDTFLRCYQGCLPSCSLRRTFHFRRQLSGTGRSGGQETNNRMRILRSFIIVAKRQPYKHQTQLYNRYYNNDYTPYYTHPPGVALAV